jgi:small subunit ribosomal protein S1
LEKAELSENPEENQKEEPVISQEGGDGEHQHPMDALLREGYGLEAPRRGEVRVGTIANITDSSILVDVGAKSEGVIPTSELDSLSEERRAEIQIGKEVTVYVQRTRGTDGIIDLSLVRAEEEEDWREAEEYLESEEPYEGEISGFNKGGLIVKMGHLRGFLPASQVGFSRRRRAKGETPEARWGEMLGEPIVARVIEVERSRNRLILSERAAEREARDVLKERLIDELEIGEVRTGHVISLADFGAFVDIGGADGLVHSSEISWKRVAHPSEVLKVGQEVEVKVLSLDPKRKRISLTMRELEADPWEDIVAEFQEGQLVAGRVTKLTKFGAFASLIDAGEYEIEGLIHISELAERRIEHPKEVVSEGQELTLRIINIDQERRRIGLSLKQVDSTQYAEIDWQTAMQDIEAGDEGESAVAAEGLSDQDAPAERGKGPAVETESQVLEGEIEARDDEEAHDEVESKASAQELDESGETQVADSGSDSEAREGVTGEMLPGHNKTPGSGE